MQCGLGHRQRAGPVWRVTKLDWLLGIFAALTILGSTQVAVAHDNWILRQRFHDPVSRSWCCDEHDWLPIDEEEVEVTGNGFLLSGRYFVARERVLPSNDTQFWVYFNPERKGIHERAKNVRCFFAPLNM